MVTGLLPWERYFGVEQRPPSLGAQPLLFPGHGGSWWWSTEAPLGTGPTAGSRQDLVPISLGTARQLLERLHPLTL